MSTQHLDRATKALERIALVLAALYAQRLEDADQGAKAEKLSHLGFTNVQIADALGTTANTINVALHNVRKSGSRSKKSRTSKKKGIK